MDPDDLPAFFDPEPLPPLFLATLDGLEAGEMDQA